MEEIIAVALQSMHHDKTRLERIGMNLTNTLTPGYKREVVAVRPFGELINRGAAAISAIPGVNGAGTYTAMLPSAFRAGGVGAVEALETSTDIRPGTLKSTGNSLDFALAGEGFFEVITENGPAYTRQGNFRLDERGRLVTAQGYPVMGKSGDLFLNSSRPVVDAVGNITDIARPGSGNQDQPTTIGQLKIVNFKDAKQLPRMGEGLVAGGSDMAQLRDSDIQLRQGFLENANVSTMREMVDLMQTMRHFESMQKAMQGYDEMIGSAIRRLSDG